MTEDWQPDPYLADAPPHVAIRSIVHHLDGVPWHQAPIPRRLHHCTPQTKGVIDAFPVERCACGAIRSWLHGDDWIERNSRRNDCKRSRRRGGLLRRWL